MNFRSLFILVIVYGGFMIARYVAEQNMDKEWVSHWYGPRRLNLRICLNSALISALIFGGIVYYSETHGRQMNELMLAFMFLSIIVFFMSLVAGVLTLFGKKV